MWHASFICVTWLIHMCDMIHSHVWHDLSIHDQCTCDVFTRDMTHREQFLDTCAAPCVTWLIHMSHDSYSCVTWLIHMCDMTYGYTTYAHVTYSWVTWLMKNKFYDSYRTSSRYVCSAMCTWHDQLKCALFVRDVTLSCVMWLIENRF